MEMQATQADYRDQLPKKNRFTTQAVFNSLAGLASIVSFFLAIAAALGKSVEVIFTIIYLVIFNILLVVYVIYAEMQKTRRYAQCVFFTHYVNHVIRDFLARKDRSEKMSEAFLKEILDAVSSCFSIITGSVCRTSLKELNLDQTISTVARDSITKCSAKKDRNIKHKLEDNTDFYNLWYAKDGCSRYFLSNDLIGMWKKDQYKNSSFNLYGKEPKLTSRWSRLNWPLPYKSALVLPIRYISEFIPPSLPSDSSNPLSTKEDNTGWLYWGFLCIDSNKKNVFDSRYIPELGGTFADVLHILFGGVQEKDNKVAQNGKNSNTTI